MLLNKYTDASSEQDDDRDGVADAADKCSNTPWGDQVDGDGCSTGRIVAQPVSSPVIKSSRSGDQDGDRVPDNSDDCPQTPSGAKVDEGGCWSTQDILFDFDSHIVKRSYYPVLDDVFAVLMMNPTLKIEVQGSADNIGSAAYNQLLSEKRARAVKNYLVQKGIEPGRLDAVGYGTTRKAASNNTAAGRALNRRIDFLVIR
jgi:OOP family OmpA-OmpF porin